MSMMSIGLSSNGLIGEISNKIAILELKALKLLRTNLTGVYFKRSIETVKTSKFIKKHGIQA